MTQERVERGMAQGCHACMEISATGDTSGRGLRHTCSTGGAKEPLPWVTGTPTVEQVAAHQKDHPLPGRGVRGLKGATWLIHEGAGDAWPCLATLTAVPAGTALDAGRGLILHQAEVLIANGLAFWQPLPDCKWAASARYLPCTAEGLPVCLLSGGGR